MVPYMSCLAKGIRVVFAMPNRISYSLMLAFAARHGISPIIDRDELTADGITRSLDKLRAGKTRYRGVLYAPEQE